MSRRSMAISSLLCDDSPQPHSATPSPAVNDPVLLAPHLRPQSHHSNSRPSSKDSERERLTRELVPLSALPVRHLSPSPPPTQDTRRRDYILHTESDMDPPRSLPRSYNIQLEQHQHQQFVQRQRQSEALSLQRDPSFLPHSRPSSSRSSDSPRLTYSYTPVPISPSTSPTSTYNNLPQHASSPLTYHHPSRSPILLHRPHSSSISSSHSHSHSDVQQLQPPPQAPHSHARHPGSHPRSVQSPSMKIFPVPPSSHSPHIEPISGLEALVHAASEEHRRLSGGSASDSDGRPPNSTSTSMSIDQFNQMRVDPVYNVIELQPYPQSQRTHSRPHSKQGGHSRTASLEERFLQLREREPGGLTLSPEEEYRRRSEGHLPSPHAFLQPLAPSRRRKRDDAPSRSPDRDRDIDDLNLIGPDVSPPILPVPLPHHHLQSHRHQHEQLMRQREYEFEQQRLHEEQQQRQHEEQQRRHHELLLQQEQQEHRQRHEQRDRERERERMLQFQKEAEHRAQSEQQQQQQRLYSDVSPPTSSVSSSRATRRVVSPTYPIRPLSPPSTSTSTSSPSTSTLQIHHHHNHRTHHAPQLTRHSIMTADPNDRPVKKRRYSSSPEDPQAHTQAHVDAKRNRELIGPGVGIGAGMDLNLRHMGKTESFSPPPPPPPPQVVTAQPRLVLESQMYMGRERAQGRFGLGIEDGGFGVRIEGVGNEPTMEVVVPRPVSSRRSPPGSSAGRAKSARKSDAADNPSHGAVPVAVAVKDGHAHEKEKKEEQQHTSRKQKHVQHHPRLSGEMQNAVSSSGELLAEKQQQQHLHSNEHGSGGSGPPKKTPAVHGHGHGHQHQLQIHHPEDKPDQQDPHEWFLEHYDELAPGIVKKKHQPTPVLPPPASPRHSPTPSKSPVRTKPRTPTPTPESAVAALEQELEEVVVRIETPTSIATSKDEEQKTEMDIDVDLAVAELVAETLEDNDVGHGRDRLMEVDDVEDELLSLVDDRPSARRLSSGPAFPSSASAHHGGKAARHESDAHHVSPPIASTSASPASFLAATARASSSRPTPERGSMPPPVSTHVGPAQAHKKGDRAASVTATAGMKKKKEPAAKAAPKPKPPPKPRGKPGPKAKPKIPVEGAATASGKVAKPSPVPAAVSAVKKAGSAAAASRSRSTSVMPGGSVGPDAESKDEKEEEEEVDSEDDKLYCICKTRYDEDKVMIACDRCDDWYHTQCVKMPDLEVDLVDQFFCPPCIEKNPQLSLRTTYKKRCMFGQKHPNPSSLSACHKPARGAFSKYCSDECGVKYMQTRIDNWSKKGGKKEKLWESVKGAEKREGVVVCADPSAEIVHMEVDGEIETKAGTLKKRGKIQHEVDRLNGLLDHVVKLREEVKKGMDVVLWRERLVQLASQRASQIGLCGWDQRLCFSDEEWADYGAGVLESYEERQTPAADDIKEEGSDAMEVDGDVWCSAKMCERHAGWQTVRLKDVCKEKEKKEEALLKLTTREREIRKRIEDIVDPQSRTCNDPPSNSKPPLKSNTKLSNGHATPTTNGDLIKKGKKRKAPA